MDSNLYINIYINGEVGIDMANVTKNKIKNIEQVFKNLGLDVEKDMELTEEPTIYDYSKRNVLDTSTYARV